MLHLIKKVYLFRTFSSLDPYGHVLSQPEK